MPFDPTKYGAKPVGKPGSFNPAAAGGRTVQAAQTTFPTEEPPEVKRKWYEKVAKFTGIEKFGQGIAGAIRTQTGEVDQDIENQQKSSQAASELMRLAREEKDLERKKRLLKLAMDNGAVIDPEEIDPTLKLTNREILGSAANVALLATGGGSLSSGVKASGTIATKLPTVAKVLNKTAQIATKGGLPAKIARGAAEGYGFDIAQNATENKDNVFKPGFGTAFGAGTPVVGAALRFAGRFTGRLIKGIGSGLSGASTKTIDEIMANPKLAKKVSAEIAKKGNGAILKKNAEDIVNGVAGIKKEARAKFGKGLEALSKEDIKPATFREQTEAFLDKFGSSVDQKTGQRILENVEFEDPKNLKKASELIDRLSKSDLDGKSLRKLMDDIENSAYKTATSDERLSYNAFVRELADTVKTSVSNSTDKLDDINKAFSTDMQLAEAVESIFGKVKFKNLAEVNKASQQLETLFSKKGISPEIIDDFLERAGIGSGLKTSEAVRQIENISEKANAQGVNIGELVRQITSSVITPKMVEEIAIKTGRSKELLAPVLRNLKKLSPAARKAMLKMIANQN